MTRRVAAVHFQLSGRHDDAGARLDMMPSERRVIARVRDHSDIPVAIGLKRVGIVSVGATAALNRRIIRHHQRLEPFRNRWVDRRPLPEVAGQKQRTHGHQKHRRSDQRQHSDRAEVLHGPTLNVRTLKPRDPRLFPSLPGPGHWRLAGAGGRISHCVHYPGMLCHWLKSS